MKNNLRLIQSTCVLATILTLSGCMKTRAQMRGEPNEPEATEEAAAQNSPVKSRYEVEEMKNEFTKLSGKIEELEHSQKNQNFTELKEYVTRLDGRVADLEKNQILILSELKELKDKKVAEEKEVSISPKDHLTNANQLLADGKCDEALEGFAAAVKHGKGKEVVDAHFGAGEANYCLKDYKKAIVEYSKVQDLNPKSSKVPTTLYKIALSFKKLNMAKEAEGFLAELLEKYPKSPEAKKARGKAKE